MAIDTLLLTESPTKNGTVRVADLPIIDFAALEAGDPKEAARLFKAASADGFFQLDFTNTSAQQAVLDNLPAVYDVGTHYFSRPDAAKRKDERVQAASIDRGFKSSPADETFEIARDELWGEQPALPDVFQASRPLLWDFCGSLDQACRVMLSSLSNSLGVGNHLDTYHDSSDPSESGLKFITEPTLARVSDVGENLHTDGGTFTVVFCERMGLHAYFPSCQEWAFIPPRKGCAVINVADSLARFSGGKLHSPQHRVTQTEDGAGERFYLSYFLRPSHKALAEEKAKAA